MNLTRIIKSNPRVTRDEKMSVVKKYRKLRTEKKKNPQRSVWDNED